MQAGPRSVTPPPWEPPRAAGARKAACWALEQPLLYPDSLAFLQINWEEKKSIAELADSTFKMLLSEIALMLRPRDVNLCSPTVDVSPCACIFAGM